MTSTTRIPRIGALPRSRLPSTVTVRQGRSSSPSSARTPGSPTWRASESPQRAACHLTGGGVSSSGPGGTLRGGQIRTIEEPNELDGAAVRRTTELSSGRRLRVGIVAPPWLPVPPIAYGGTETVLDTLAR